MGRCFSGALSLPVSLAVINNWSSASLYVKWLQQTLTNTEYPAQMKDYLTHSSSNLNIEKWAFERVDAAALGDKKLLVIQKRYRWTQISQNTTNKQRPVTFVIADSVDRDGCSLQNSQCERKQGVVATALQSWNICNDWRTFVLSFERQTELLLGI